MQKLWQDIYCLPDLPVDASQWDQLFADGETFRIGSLDARVMLSPGHTLASITYLVGDAAFVHDMLIVPDSGTSRADFPGGDARALWRSIRAILDLPPGTATYVGHDYGKDGREVIGRSTVAEQRRDNIHVHDGINEAELVATREKPDATLPLPDLMLAALQVNIRGGRLPDAEPCGTAFSRCRSTALEPANERAATSDTRRRRPAKRIIFGITAALLVMVVTYKVGNPMRRCTRRTRSRSTRPSLLRRKTPSPSGPTGTRYAAVA